ncbi:MAG: serine hydrolase, partial [Bacillota bacterium]|nr:serine hydrolase [Bacillota bacterium]
MRERLRNTSESGRTIPAGRLLRLLDGIAAQKLNLHGLLVARGWNIELEAYWPPFGRGSIHRMYSISKSFTATAIGLLVAEGKLKLTDHIVDFYPELVPKDAHPLIREMTIRDMLMMATGRSGIGYHPQSGDWLGPFFTVEPQTIPGTIFRYDTSASNVLAALVERLGGQEFMGYLGDKLLGRLGFSEEALMLRAPGGIPFGGSAVCCTLRDLARFAIFWNQGGKLDGEAILPADYVAQATSFQITEAEQAFANNQHLVGYGYQIWIMDEGFAFLGMGSQLAFCYPQRDLVICTIADTQAQSAAVPVLLQILHECILNNDNKENSEAELERRIAGLRMPLLPGETTSPWMAKIDGRICRLVKPVSGIEAVRVDREGEGIRLSYLRDGKWLSLQAGLGCQLEAPFPEAKYHGREIGVTSGVPYRCLFQ